MPDFTILILDLFCKLVDILILSIDNRSCIY